MDSIIEESLFSSNTQPESERLEILKQHFPNCFDKNGAFLPEKMAEILHSDGVATQKESYSLNWLGKSYAKVLRNMPPETLLAEDTAHNRLPANQNSENILIKGDNLEVLKHLKNAYKNQIKMIYIDPPYNTGSDGFVYQDDRQFTPEQLAQLGGMDLEEAKRVLEFTAKKSNSHSAWLTFMYPRLYIARELLRDDGVIFISIDDNEQAQLKILCDEVFGEENFLTTISVKLSEATGVKMTHAKKRIPKLKEYILCFKKSDNIIITPIMENKPEWDNEYKNIILGLRKDELEKIKLIADDEDRSKQDILAVNKILSKCNFANARQVCKEETGKDLTDEWLFENAYRIIQFVTMTGGALQQAKEVKLSGSINGEAFSIITPKNKMYFIKTDFNHESELPRSKILFADEYLQMNMGDFWKDIKTTGLDNEGDVPFKNGKKPLKLIKRLLSLATKENDLILDFFAGSGTTAHAVMKLNAEQNGNHHFICVQLPEKTDEKSEAYKAGYETIFEITKARIQKASQKIKDENPNYSGDLGFKIFETIPNFQAAVDVDFDPIQAEIPNSKNAMLNDEQLYTLLTTWRVYDGCKLPEKVQTIDLDGYTAYYCRQHLYLLAKGFHSDSVKALIEKLDNDKEFIPKRIVLFSANIDSAMQKELAQAVKTYANKKGLTNLSVLARV